MSNFCDPVDCSLPGSSVHGTLHVRILEWVVISFSRGYSRPRKWVRVSCIAGRSFTDWAMSTIVAAAAKSLQLCPTLCDPVNGSPPGSAIPGILQARTLERVAISFSNAWKWKVKVKSLLVQLVTRLFWGAYFILICMIQSAWGLGMGVMSLSRLAYISQGSLF